MKFVFLYTEIAEYFMACCKELSKHGEVHVIRWPVNKEAPFKFDSHQIKLYQKNDYTFQQLQSLIKNINPNIIICSGWVDKDYLKLTKPYFKKIPTVMSCDTHWKGNLKQRLATIISRFTLLRIFSHAWVPGKIQQQYVLNLGFKPQNIETGFYSCDLTHFETIYHAQKTIKENKFPKRFLYVGRYYDYKGVLELWKAFLLLQSEHENDWELWNLGTGDIPPVSHPKIKHFGFIQPKDLIQYAEQTGVFILPSRRDAWGVVVHEFTASGFPIILSSAVGAKEAFLNHGKNGFEFDAENVVSLKNAMKKIIDLSDEQLIQMGKYSHQLAQHISPTTWTNSILKILSPR